MPGAELEMGGWTVAQSPILGTTITLNRLIKRWYEPMLSYYGKVSPQLNEPLYNTEKKMGPALNLMRIFLL
ncbi:hypothetical protein BH23BAC1_BH23BAC1_43580 [soil metagenome]